MTRSLPWITKQEREKNASRKTGAITKQSSVSHNGATTNAPLIENTVKGIQHTSSISSLPLLKGRRDDERHPAHVSSKCSLMRDGFDADDKWRMVEDELLETAKTFTQSLRQAEYERLMNNALDGRSSGAHRISRPTIITSQSIGKAQGLNVHRQKITSKRKFAQENYAKDDYDEDDAPWLNDDCLADLMTGCETKVKELMDPSDASSPDNPPVMSRQMNLSSGDKRTQDVRSIVQDPDSDEDDDLDCSPSLSASHDFSRKPVSINNDNGHIQSNRNISWHTNSEKKSTNKYMSDICCHQETMSYSTTGIPQNRLNTSKASDNDCAVVESLPTRVERSNEKNHKLLSLKSSIAKTSKRRFSSKAVSLNEIPTFLV